MAFSADEIERYARHLVLAEVGGPGQQALASSTVLIVGAGGVGGPAALYLTAAGVGAIRIVDPDAVALSNLQRQIQFATGDIGAEKVQALADHLGRLNPHVRVQPVAEAFDRTNSARLLAGVNIVLDGTDDFMVRHAVNAACVEAGAPLVSGALGRWSGQVAVFHSRPCYRCLVPQTPADPDTCARVGVVGALAGVVGAMAALEAIKLITRAGQPLTGRMLLYDGLSATSRTVSIPPDPECPVCSSTGTIRAASGDA